jgi:hypothetical protein
MRIAATGLKSASVSATNITALDSRGAGTTAAKAGAPGAIWQPHCAGLSDSLRSRGPAFFIAAIMVQPVGQHMEDFAWVWHGFAANVGKGPAPSITRSIVVTILDKNFIPVYRVS